jgi:uncharacterized protein YndB with AHSA1/START domain
MSNLLLNFLIDKAQNTITIKREFAAELALVWDAYTKSELLDQWWAPQPWKAKTKSMDFREGGSWHYAMIGPEGEEHWGKIDYKKIQRQKSFTGIDSFTDAEANIKEALPQSNWTVNFTSNADLTLVESQIVFDDLAQLEATIQMGFKEGITIAMEGLDKLLITLSK